MLASTFLRNFPVYKALGKAYTVFMERTNKERVMTTTTETKATKMLERMKERAADNRKDLARGLRNLISDLDRVASNLEETNWHSPTCFGSSTLARLEAQALVLERDYETLRHLAFALGRCDD